MVYLLKTFIMLCGWLLSCHLSKISAKLVISLKEDIIFAKFIKTVWIHFFFNKQLGLGPSPQSCLHFHDFQGSKLLSICLAVWPNKHFSCVFPRFLVNHIINFSDCSKKFLLNSKLLLCFVALVQQCKLERNL